MLEKMRKERLEKKAKRCKRAVKKCFRVSKEYKNMGDNLNAMYWEARAAKLMYKEAVIIDKLVRA